MSPFEKIRWLKPDDATGSVRVIVDSRGDIGSIRRERMEGLATGLEPVIESSGRSGVVIEFRLGDETVRVLGWQVVNMMKKWSEKKAAVFGDERTGQGVGRDYGEKSPWVSHSVSPVTLDYGGYHEG
jgi:hypothetical protein